MEAPGAEHDFPVEADEIGGGAVSGLQIAPSANGDFICSIYFCSFSLSFKQIKWGGRIVCGEMKERVLK